MAKKTQKSHGGLSKTLKVRPGGSIKRGKQGGRHNTGKKSSNFSRKKRFGETLSKADMSRLKSLINQ
jgi:ribosomal protein L35